ncbi:MAG: hypothetical protein V1672_01250 [Candidatus Diapherotrites archaeon]
MSKYFFIILVLLLGVTLIFGCAEPIENKEIISDGKPAELIIEKPKEKIPNPDRELYGTGIFIDENRNTYESEIKNAFVNLPEMPEDFADVKFYLETEGFDFIVPKLTEAYYKQPEFLPNFEQAALPYWENPDLTHWGVYGYGSYPSKLSYVMKKNESLDIYFFVYSAWKIETYQGTKIVPVISDELKEKFDFEISPENILLEPTYPKVSENWIYKIRIKITPLETLEKDTYEIRFDFAEPDSELNNGWGEKYKYYFPVGSGISDSKSGVDVKLIVSE